MEARLTSITPEQRKREKEINLHSVVHCNEERQRLRECFRNSWFGYCSKEQAAFWGCFNKERDRQNLLDKCVTIPENHWADNPPADGSDS